MEKVKVKIEVELEIKDGKVVIPAGTTQLMKFNNASRYCKNLTSIEIPDSVTKIGKE